MNDMKMLVWTLPVLFIFHDMEEIVFQKSWKIKHSKIEKNSIKAKFFGNCNSTAAFSMAVYEELILTIIFSMIGIFTNHYELWYGTLWANTLHLIIIHLIGGTVIFKAYTPGVISAAICLFPSIYVIYKSMLILNYSIMSQTIYILIMTAITLLNLKFLHKNMNKFEKIIY